MDDQSTQYNGYVTTIHNFTEHGWGLTKALQHIVDLLKESLHNGLIAQKDNPTYESRDCAINGALAPFFIEQEHLNEKVLHKLLPLHEAWAGVPLFPNNPYGMRVYRDGVNLIIHLDKVETHIISSILHV